METISGRGRMQVSMYPQMFPRRIRTRNRSPQVSKYSANRLRSYASRGKIARSISRILSMSDRRKRLMVNSEDILLSFILAHLEPPWKPLGSKKRGKQQPALDKYFGLPHTGIEMQLSGNCETLNEIQRSLVDLHRGDAAILDGIDLPGEEARREAIRRCSRWTGRKSRCAGKPRGASRCGARKLRSRFTHRGRDERLRGLPNLRYGSGPVSGSADGAQDSRGNRAAQLGQDYALQPPHRSSPESAQFPRRHRGAAHRDCHPAGRPPGATDRPSRRLQSFAALGRRAGGL